MILEERKISKPIQTRLSSISFLSVTKKQKKQTSGGWSVCNCAEKIGLGKPVRLMN